MYSPNTANMSGGGGGPMAPESQTLLPNIRYPQIPTSASHLADQMESGGAKVEETLSRFNCKYQTLFFGAGLAVLFGAVLGFIGSFLHLQPANSVNSLFMILFGIIMMILDVPGSPRWAGRYRQLCRKYSRFLTRLTGKSLWFLFLGSMTACNLWPTKKGYGGLVLVAIIVSLFVVGVSVIGLLIAVRKSLRLEKVRKAVQQSCKGAFLEVYRKYAMTDFQHGMQFEEFNRMCADHTFGKLQFDVTDLGIVYNALDENQKSAINEREYTDWLGGSTMTYI
eukprot:GHVQ01027390.1.p1 GENE.GHVQ01027390.1~~GHVQ01027390.1.p1  ORF type:complete len:280 (+),score=33.48 GHVQ01027390.1:600-1439(+)